MKLAAVLLPAACRLAYTESSVMKKQLGNANELALVRCFIERLRSVPNLSKPTT